MNPAKSLIRITQKNRLLTAAEFRHLADVPAEVEWFRNIDNPHTTRAYRNAISEFMQFSGIRRPEEFRLVTRAHVIAWRDELVRRNLDRATVRHRLSALASLFEFLCDKNAVTHNPVKGVKRPKADTNEGKTPALALFRPLPPKRYRGLRKSITPDGVYKLVRDYSARLGFEIGAHALRATAATNALDHKAEIAEVQEWLGHVEYFHHTAVRPSQVQTRRQPDIQNSVLEMQKAWRRTWSRCR